MKNLGTRVSKLEIASDGAAEPVVIFRAIIDNPTDEPNCARYCVADDVNEWERLPGETYDAFTARIAADLPKGDGAARVIMWSGEE